MSYRQLYRNVLPIMTVYSTIIGIDAGITINKFNRYDNNFQIYANLIGYTSIGIITGITYPISYPLFGCYVLFNNKKN